MSTLASRQMPLVTRMASRGLTSKAYAGAFAASAQTKASGRRVKRFIITTDALDRDGDIIVPSGMRVDEYMRNPIVLWAHRFDEPPIGKCISLSRTASGIEAELEFFDDGPHGVATRIFRLVDEGYLNAVSVGFKLISAGPPDASFFHQRPADARLCKRVVSLCSLLEVSVVPIGCNPEAMQVLASKGLAAPNDLGFPAAYDETMVDDTAERAVMKIEAGLAVVVAGEIIGQMSAALEPVAREARIQEAVRKAMGRP